MARRIRKTITVSESDHTPRRRRKKQTSTAIIVIVLALIGFFLLSRTRQAGGFHNAPLTSRAR
jgi:hypothetical protein